MARVRVTLCRGGASYMLGQTHRVTVAMAEELASAWRALAKANGWAIETEDARTPNGRRA